MRRKTRALIAIILSTFLFAITLAICGDRDKELIRIVHSKGIDTELAKFPGAINILDYGAGHGGDDTAAIQSAIDAVGPNGGLVYLPRGSYTVTRSLNVRQFGVNLLGAGKYGTFIMFNPSEDSALFNVVCGITEQTVIAYGSIKGFGLIGAGRFQKVGIRLTDVSNYSIEDIVVGPGGTPWSGNTSIGIQTRGRESSTIRNVQISADRPISVEKNPNSSIDLDHFHFENTYLIPTNSQEACVHVDPGLNLTNITFDGYNAWCGGKYGFFWSNTGGAPTGAASANLHLSNIRYEQNTDSDGYIVYIDNYLQNCLIQNVYGVIPGKGYYFRNNQQLTLQNCYYTGQPSTTPIPEALNIDGSCCAVSIINCFFQIGSTLSISGLSQIFSMQQYNQSAPCTMYFDTKSSPYRWLTIYGVKSTRETGNLNKSCSKTISTDSRTVGILHLAAYSSSGPVNEGGVFMVSKETVKLISGTTNVVTGKQSNKLCVVYNNSNKLQLVNNLPVSLGYVLTIDWR